MAGEIDIYQLKINEQTYNLEDAFSREQIETIKKTIAGGVTYVGATTTELSDGATTATVAIKTGDTTENHTAASGDMVDYNNVLFLFNKSGQWDQLGSAGVLKALAYKDSVSASYTPAGSVSQPTFSGTEQNVSVTGTPKGSVSVTAAAPTSGEKANYTPDGSVSVKPTTETVQQITGVGTLPSLSTSVENGVLSIDFSQGTLPTRSGVTVATGVESASFTGNGAVIKGSFTGESGSFTGSITPSGTVSKPSFTGSPATITSK